MVAMATAVRVRTVRGKREREGERERERGTGIRRWRRRKVEGRRGQRDSKRERERELCLRLRDSISIICRFVDSELCDYAPPPPPTSSSSSTVFCLPPPLPSTRSDFSSSSNLLLRRHPLACIPPRIRAWVFALCMHTCVYTRIEAIYIYIYVDAKRSLVTAPEPSIRLFAWNRFHVFACPPLHLYKRARTTSTRRAPLCAMSRGWPVGPLSLPAVFLPALSPLCRSRASRCQSLRSRNFLGGRESLREWQRLPLPPLLFFFVIVVAVDRSLIRNHDDEGCARPLSPGTFVSQ